MAHNILGLPKEIEVAIEIENQEARVEVIDHIMLLPHQEEFRTEIVLEIGLWVVVITGTKYHHQGPTTTGESTLRFELHLLPRGLEAMAVQHHPGLIGTFVEEVVNM